MLELRCFASLQIGFSEHYRWNESQDVACMHATSCLCYLVNPGGLVCPPWPPKPGGRLLLPPPNPGGRVLPPGGNGDGGRIGGRGVGSAGGGGTGRIAGR